MNATSKALMFAGLVMAGLVSTALAAPRAAGSKIEGTAGAFDVPTTGATGLSYAPAAVPAAVAPATTNANRAYSVAPAQPAPRAAAPVAPAPAARAAQPARQFSYAPQAAAAANYVAPAAAVQHTWSFGVRDAGSKIKGTL